MSTDKNMNGIAKKLDLIILLLLETGSTPAISITQKIERLTAYGLLPGEVAAILGKPVNYVTAVLSGRKKISRKKSTKKDSS